MAASASLLSLSSISFGENRFKIISGQVTTKLSIVTHKKQPLLKSKPSFLAFHRLDGLRFLSSSTSTRASSNGFFDTTQDKEILPSFEPKPAKFLFWVAFWASLSLVWFAASGDANAAVDSIKASGFGLKIATAFRRLGWPDEAVVFALATLPVLELRGAIPVGYWMQLKPIMLTILSVVGNQSASRFLDMLFENAKEKSGPVKEFQWLGLMLFVAVPFPGTGAWTGAIIASILDMPFWSAVSANFCGVVLAGLLVNLLVNLGLKYATITGIILFFISTFMWSILRHISKSSSL